MDKEEELLIAIERINQEVILWRKWYLKKQMIENEKVRAFFLSIPSMSFLNKSPEENLIECLMVYANENFSK
jgi:hypothetical protein